MGAGHVRAEASARGERAVERERLRLALDLHRGERLVVEDPLRLSVGRLGDSDPAHRCRPLQARSGVHDVARDEPLSLLGAGTQGDDGLAGVDADPYLEGERGVVVVQVVDRLEEAECGANRALGVVLVRDRRAEDRHHRVPDELLHGAAVPLDLLPQARVVRPDPRADILRVGGIRGRREADQVAEEDGDDLALLHRRGRRLHGQRGTTERTERKVPRELLTARRAGRHARSLAGRRRGAPRRKNAESSCDDSAFSPRLFAPTRRSFRVSLAPTRRSSRVSLRRLGVRG